MATSIPRRQKPTAFPNEDAGFTTIRPYFNALASETEAERLEASCQILSGLEPYFQGDGVGNKDGAVWQALERLVKGLASGRKAARIGFSITLAELLSRISAGGNESTMTIDLAEVLNVLLAHTQPTGGVSKQEERDHYLGRLFGLEAIVDSDVLFAPTTSSEYQDLYVTRILELAKKKSWLREECGWILFKALRASPEGAEGERFAKTMINDICERDFAHTPEGVAVWLSVLARYPEVHLPKAPWHHRDPLHPKNMTTLPAVMKESSQRGESNDEVRPERQRGMWSSKPHFSWDVLFDRLNKSAQTDTKAKTVSFQDFWCATVDNSLFAADASDERKHWGFSLFSKAISEYSSEVIPHVFSKNMVRCLINQLSNRERYLHKTAQKVLRGIHARVEQEPGTAPLMLAGLMAGYGTVSFDQITKTKTTNTILGQADPAALTKVVHMFDEIIRDPETLETKGAEVKRHFLADQLLAAVRTHKTQGESTPDEWLEDLFDMLSKHAYFTEVDTQKQPKPPLSATSRKVFASRLSSCFTALMTSRSKAAHQWLYKVLASMKARESSARKWETLIQFDDVTSKANSSAWKKVERIRKMQDEPTATAQQKSHLRALQLLYCLVIFQLYNGEGDALAVIADLDICYDKLVGKKKSKKRRESEAPEEGDEDDPSEVLIDVLLGLISKPSALLRRLAQEVFAAFAGDVTLAGLQALFKILESKENLAGQQELFDKEVEESGEEESGEDDDVSIIDAEADDVEVESEGSSSEDDSDSNSSVDADTTMTNGKDDDDELQRLNTALASITKTQPFDPKHPPPSPTHSSSSASSSSSMDDDQMFALDSQMSRVFRDRQEAGAGTNANKRNEQKDAKATILAFKNRVLDLLDVYVKQQFANPLALEILPPLLVLVRSTGSRQISDRAAALVREFAQKAKTGVNRDSPPAVDREAILTLLDQIHMEADRPSSSGAPRSHAGACSAASLLLVRMLVTGSAAGDEDIISAVVARYSSTLRHWLLGEWNVAPAMFSDFVNWGTAFATSKRKGPEAQGRAETLEGKTKAERDGKEEEEETVEVKTNGKNKRKVKHGQEDGQVEQDQAEDVENEGDGKGKKKKRKKNRKSA
ncbi:MAG: hypothetical protein M4579_000922 [Chaenotheca gracillima]|nr:MAG: hypothetical protein M4579_000922 [Chaenotheca gracillima]